MTRNIIAISSLLVLAPMVWGQDMPLSQILIEGEGWKKTTGDTPALTFGFKSVGVSTGNRSTVHETYIFGGKTFHFNFDLKKTESTTDRRGTPTTGVASLDGGTVFIGHDTGYIWAYQAKADGTLLHGHPYCPVREAKVEGKTQPSQVTAMAGDKDGRIYAATPLGVQVFDPTGRLCGVLTPAAPGKPEHMTFEADKLTLWIGDTKYERKLNTTGVKR